MMALPRGAGSGGPSDRKGGLMEMSGPVLSLVEAEIVHVETGHYTVRPLATISRAEQVLAQIGVDLVVQVDPTFTDSVPIFRANETSYRPKCHRAACISAPPPTLLNNPPRESYGKGITAEQSKASAMMEAVERYSAQPFPHSDIVPLSREEARDRAVPLAQFNFPEVPLKCLRCPERDQWCFPDLERACDEWTRGYSLVSGKPVLVPSATVFYPYLARNGVSFMFNDTGGLAAGNTVEEAILQGMAEVIERDALYSAFNLGDLANTPILRFDGLEGEHVRHFFARSLPADSIFAFSIANHDLCLDIPTICAFVCYREGGQRRYFGGSGTSLDPGAALLRALTELVQQKVRQKAFRTFDPGHLVRHNGLKSADVLPFGSIADQSRKSIKESIELLLRRIAAAGSDVIVVDLTHPVIGIPVVRVIAPKLIAYSGSHIKESVFLDTMGRWSD